MITIYLNCRFLFLIREKRKMNFKRTVGLGLLASLISCGAILDGANCEHNKPAPGVFVVAPAPRPSAPSGRPVVPGQDSRDRVHPNQEGNHNGWEHRDDRGEGSGRGDRKDRDEEKSDGRGVVSHANHVHTSENAAGERTGKGKIVNEWKTKEGESHQTEQSEDKEGNHHQIHRWVDVHGRSHETDHWTDKNNNVHQCHRWNDDKEAVHESVHVTDKDGKVVSEHFKKDKDGKITKIEHDDKDDQRWRERHERRENDSKGRREHSSERRERSSDSKNNGRKEEHSKDDRDGNGRGPRENEHRREPNSHSSNHPEIKPAVVTPAQPAGPILHSANCVVGNLRNNS